MIPSNINNSNELVNVDSCNRLVESLSMIIPFASNFTVSWSMLVNVTGSDVSP